MISHATGLIQEGREAGKEQLCSRKAVRNQGTGRFHEVKVRGCERRERLEPGSKLLEWHYFGPRYLFLVVTFCIFEKACCLQFS